MFEAARNIVSRGGVQRAVRSSATIVRPGRVPRAGVASASVPTRPPARPQARWSSTDAGSTSQTHTPLRKAAPAVVLAAASGLLGYFLAGGPAPAPAPPGSSPAHVKFNDQYGSAKDFQKAVEALRAAFPAEGVVSTSQDILERHAKSYGTLRDAAPPTVVVFPLSTEDVVKIVNISRKYRMPLIPYSGGTSLENHLKFPPSGGICVDMSKMNRILEIHEADGDLVCQAGAGWVQINETLKKKGIPLFFPLDPAPGATIGGMVGCGCSGTNAVRYGTARGEWFLNLTVVLPSGEVIKTRRRSRKSSAGFDSAKIFIGAEGTLGIVTEATIRLAPVLPTRVAVVQFPDVHKAAQAAIDVLNQGVGLQCVELCDATFMRATNAYGRARRKYPERDSVYFKLQGATPAVLDDAARAVRAVCERHGASGFEYARGEAEADELWADRKNGFYSGLALAPGARAMGTDVCVPISRLPDLVQETRKDLEASGLVSPMIGHVGDGNFHAMLLFHTEAEYKAAREIVDRMVHRAIDLDGTCTGEHGVGIGKRKYLYDELGENTVEFMKMLKRTIDPLNLFNPGKLYPDHPGEQSPGKR